MRRGVGRPSISSIYDMPPPLPKRGRSLEEVEFADVSIPLALAPYRDPTSSVASIMRGPQDIVNDVSESMAKAAASPPPYKPYIAPDYSLRTLLPRMAVHTNVLGKWQTRAPRVQGGQEHSPQMRLRRHLRFVSASDLCRAWGSFGGLSARLARVKSLLSLAPTGNSPPPRNALSRGVIPIFLGGRAGAYRA